MPDQSSPAVPRFRLPSACAFALAALASSGSLAAQLQPQAIYPLLTDLLETTATYTPAQLTGNPTPPNPPANGVCVNGIYSLSAGGQDVRFPVITSLNMADFQVDVEFLVNAFPPSFGAPVFMGGHLWRWLGIYVQPNGTVGIKHNNSNLAWSTTMLSTGTWYSGRLKYENGTVELYIDGTLVLTVSVGVLSTGSATIDNRNFTTNDFSNGRNHNGCIRNVIISNDTTLGVTAGTFAYGSGCDGLTLGANGVPSLGNPLFELVATNVPPAVPLAYFAFGGLALNPGVDLTFIGMAGCAAYTSLDIGLLGPAVVVGPSANFPFPIPNDPALTGASLATQALSFSTATTLGLAASNGLKLVLAP
ncbi:MAG TPA: hypothetical protein VF384_03430 [Planctomycetota bacterium]